MSTSSLIESDRKHLIHPVASLRAHEERGVTILESGRGAWLRDIDGNELLDAFSGLWCVNTGYGHDSIVRVATEQMSRLPYATGYFHFGCEPAILLAEQLVELAPNSLRHVYFTLGGSDAVDAAIRYITNYYNWRRAARRRSSSSHWNVGITGRWSVGAGLTALSCFTKTSMCRIEPASHPITLSVSQRGGRRSAGGDRRVGRRVAREGGSARRRARGRILLRAGCRAQAA